MMKPTGVRMIRGIGPTYGPQCTVYSTMSRNRSEPTIMNGGTSARPALDPAQSDAFEPNRVCRRGEDDEEQERHRHRDHDPVPDRVAVDVAHGCAGPIRTGVGSGSGSGGWIASSRWMGKMPA